MSSSRNDTWVGRNSNLIRTLVARNNWWRDCEKWRQTVHRRGGREETKWGRGLGKSSGEHFEMWRKWWQHERVGWKEVGKIDPIPDWLWDWNWCWIACNDRPRHHYRQNHLPPEEVDVARETTHLEKQFQTTNHRFWALFRSLWDGDYSKSARVHSFVAEFGNEGVQQRAAGI